MNYIRSQVLLVIGTFGISFRFRKNFRQSEIGICGELLIALANVCRMFVEGCVQFWVVVLLYVNCVFDLMEFVLRNAL